MRIGVLGSRNPILSPTFLAEAELVEQTLMEEGHTLVYGGDFASLRKAEMIDQCDGFLVLPGGLGTLGEALEVMSLKAQGSVRQSLVFYNYLGVWSPFLESLELLVQQKLIPHSLDNVIEVLDKPEQLREHFK